MLVKLWYNFIGFLLLVLRKISHWYGWKVTNLYCWRSNVRFNIQRWINDLKWPWLNTMLYYLACRAHLAKVIGVSPERRLWWKAMKADDRYYFFQFALDRTHWAFRLIVRAEEIKYSLTKYYHDCEEEAFLNEQDSRYTSIYG